MATGNGDAAEQLIVGNSPAIIELRRLVRQVGPSKASVIITGPSGAGKEVVARALHAASPRHNKNYVAVNCGAIPKELLESELFGHEKGSFTGAVSSRAGRFEEAHGGSLFLDEIGDMPLEMQVKLLRVLEERKVQRIGGRGEIEVDTRVISATHRNLDESIEAQTFREDLYYRLAVFPIDVPALADRREDVPVLVRHFLKLAKSRIVLTPDAMDLLVRHDWPGNVRELRNVVERSCVLFPDQAIGAEQIELVMRRRRRGETVVQASPPRDLVYDRDRRAIMTAVAEPTVDEVQTDPPAPQPEEPALGSGPVDLRKVMADLEYRYLAEALRVSDGVVADAARLLSLQRTTLIEKMKKYGLARAA